MFHHCLITRIKDFSKNIFFLFWNFNWIPIYFIEWYFYFLLACFYLLNTWYIYLYLTLIKIQQNLIQHFQGFSIFFLYFSLCKRKLLFYSLKLLAHLSCILEYRYIDNKAFPINNFEVIFHHFHEFCVSYFYSNSFNHQFNIWMFFFLKVSFTYLCAYFNILRP